MKKLLIPVLLFSTLQAYAADKTKRIDSEYKLYPIGLSNSTVWLLNIKTGALSRCISESFDESPKCSPWAEPPGDNPEYRYDLKTKKMIPMNKAARDKEKEKDPLKLDSSK